MELQTHCADMSIDRTEVANSPKPKPFRSELSLVLAYPQELQSDQKVETTTPSTIPISDLESPNIFYMQNLPSPMPAFPTSPLTPPINFKGADACIVNNGPEKVEDFSHLNFVPLNSSDPIFNNSSSSSIFCTVSAPSTPAFDRKCIDKFCSNDGSSDPKNSDKKKAKRVSIVNIAEEMQSQSTTTNESEEPKEATEKKAETNAANSTHHSHIHKNHSHSHLHPKRRMSLDNGSPVIAYSKIL